MARSRTGVTSFRALIVALAVATFVNMCLMAIGGSVLVALLVATYLRASDARLEAAICASRVADLKTYVAEHIGEE